MGEESTADPSRPGDDLVHEMAALRRRVAELEASEEHAREAEMRFRTFFDHAPIGKCMTGPDGRLQRANPAFCDMLGYTAEELATTSFASITHPDDVAESVECVRSLLAGERDTWSMDKRYVTKAGRLVWTHVTTRVARDAAGQPLYFLTHIENIAERKRVEEALRDSQESYRTLTEAAQDMIFTLSDEGVLTYANPFTASALHFGLEALQGKSLWEQFPEGNLDALREMSQQVVAAGESVNAVVRVEVPGGARWLDTTLVPIKKDGRATAITGIARDVTERKQVAEELRQAFDAITREKVITDSTINSTPGVFYVLDFDGRFLRWNDQLERVTEYTGEELAVLNALELFVGDDKARIAEGIRKVAETGEAKVQAELQRKSGGGTPYLFTGRRVDIEGLSRLIGMGIDVTESTRTRRDLELRNRLASIFLSSSDEDMYGEVLDVVLDALKSLHGVFGFIDDNGDLVIPSMTRHIWDSCQVPGKSMVFPRATWGESIWPRAIREKRQLFSNARSHKTPEGHLSIARNISSPLVHHGEVVGLFQVANKATDYTPEDLQTLAQIADTVAPVLAARLQRDRQDRERRRREDEVRTLNLELEHRVAQRTAQLSASNKELEAFAYSVSHDLRAPLRAIEGFSQALVAEYRHQLDDEARDYLDRSSAAARRMSHLIDDLLALSRISRQTMTTKLIDLSGIARSVVAELREREPARNVAFDLAEGLAAEGDPGLVRILLTNLIDNAWKFTAKVENARIGLCSTERNGTPVYCVEDNGAGFDMRYATKLFSPFHRLHKADQFPGLGIGLATVQRIVARHGGEVWAEAAVNQGATFYFTLSNGGDRS